MAKYASSAASVADMTFIISALIVAIPRAKSLYLFIRDGVQWSSLMFSLRPFALCASPCSKMRTEPKLNHGGAQRKFSVI